VPAQLSMNLIHVAKMFYPCLCAKFKIGWRCSNLCK